MNTVQTQTFVKKNAVKSLNLTNATQIDDYTYAIPVEVEGKTRYAKLVVTCTNNKDTKTTAAFDLNAAIAEYKDKCDERAKREAEKAAAKAAKEAKRASK